MVLLSWRVPLSVAYFSFHAAMYSWQLTENNLAAGNYLPPPSPNLALPQAPYLLLFKASARKYLFVLAS
jgi:hypothetical protein